MPLKWRERPSLLPGMKTHGAKRGNRSFIVTEDHGAKDGVWIAATFQDYGEKTTGIGLRYKSVEDAKAACEQHQPKEQDHER